MAPAMMSINDFRPPNRLLNRKFARSSRWEPDLNHSYSRETAADDRHADELERMSRIPTAPVPSPAVQQN